MLRERRSTAVTRNEAFRVLRTNLEVALLDLERPTVVITSANAGEGKTSTCVQLAHALALAGRRVVVVDLDLRHPNIHTAFSIGNPGGVTDVLLERQPLHEVLRYVTVGQGPNGRGRGIYVLPAGQTVDNPNELLAGGRIARLLQRLEEQADIVLVDSPPVLPVADTLVIGRMAAGVVLVVQSRSTTYDAALAARDALVRNQTRILGVLLNKVRPGDASGYGYGYGAEG